MITKEFPWGKVRPERGADNSAFLIAPNVKVRAELQHSSHARSLFHFPAAYSKACALPALFPIGNVSNLKYVCPNLYFM